MDGIGAIQNMMTGGITAGDDLNGMLGAGLGGDMMGGMTAPTDDLNSMLGTGLGGDMFMGGGIPMGGSSMGALNEMASMATMGMPQMMQSPVQQPQQEDNSGMLMQIVGAVLSMVMSQQNTPDEVKTEKAPEKKVETTEPKAETKKA